MAFGIPVEFSIDSAVVGTTIVRAIPLIVSGAFSDGARLWAASGLECATDADPGPELERRIVLVNAERLEEYARVWSDLTGRDEQFLALLFIRYLDATEIGPDTIFDDFSRRIGRSCDGPS